MEAAAADEDAINSHQRLSSPHSSSSSSASSSSSSSCSPAAGVSEASKTVIPIDCPDLPSVAAADEENDDPSLLPVFRPFTEESLRKIAKRIEEEARKKRDSVQQAEVSTIAGQNAQAAEKKDDEKLVPNPIFEVGKSLPSKFGNFPPSLYGRPIEDLDEYYKNRYVRSSTTTA